MAAEIGTMRVTEQIDALTTLSTNPASKYLVVPPLIAGVVTLPNFPGADRRHHRRAGRLSGPASTSSTFNDQAYLRNTMDFLQFEDVFSGLAEGRSVRLPGSP